MKRPVLGLVAVMLLMVVGNTAVLLSTFSLAQLVQPPVVFLTGISAAAIVVLLNVGRWVILRDRAVFDWRLIARRRPQEQTLAQAWSTGAAILVGLSVITILIVAFAATTVWPSR